MFGYACRETPELMPAPIFYAHKILEDLTKARKSGEARHARPGRQEPGDGPLRERQAGRRHPDRAVDPASRRGADLGRHPPRSSSPIIRKTLPEGWITEGDRLARQSDRQVRHRRSGRRLRPDRAQDHRRHLWRRGAAWRRRLLRQGSDQGRPLGRLCGALPRQERRRRRARRSLHHPARLCHRRLRAAVDLCRPARHRQGAPKPSSRRPCARSCG